MNLPSPALSRVADIHVGDALTLLSELPAASLDAVVTDPPYAIRRLRRAVAQRTPTRIADCTTRSCGDRALCDACVRADLVAKYADAPMLGQRSQNWHASETHSRGYADNDPRQFEAWCRLWLEDCWRLLKPGGHLVAFGGTRTWHRLAAAAEDVGFEIRDSLAWLYSSGMPKSQNVARALAEGAADAADQHLAEAWAGWGTTLKPAFEPIVLARRPLDGTMANNIRTWGVGPLNVNASVGADAGAGRQSAKWPTNVHLDAHRAHAFGSARGKDPSDFFWVAKPGTAERVSVDGVAHPTVKPLDLMRRLIRLVSPEGGLILDPFAGSGTTVEAAVMERMNVIAVEREPAYLPLIEKRVARAKRNLEASATRRGTSRSSGSGVEMGSIRGPERAQPPIDDTLF